MSETKTKQKKAEPEAEGAQEQPEPEAEVLEGNAVPIDGDDGEPGSSLERAQPQNPPSAIMPLAAEEVVAGMQAYQTLLPQLLDASDYQEAERGKKFVKKSGWRKIARAFGLSVEIRSQHVERDEGGRPIRANVVARAVHVQSGQYQDGDGGCSVDESRFNKSAGRQKLENDLLATATTRAKNRAISDLVGMGEVSAEEASGGGGGPKWGPEADRGLRQACGNALAFLHDNDREKAKAEIQGFEREWGYLPTALAGGVIAAASIVKSSLEPAGSEKAEGGEEGGGK